AVGVVEIGGASERVGAAVVAVGGARPPARLAGDVRLAERDDPGRADARAVRGERRGPCRGGSARRRGDEGDGGERRGGEEPERGPGADVEGRSGERAQVRRHGHSCVQAALVTLLTGTPLTRVYGAAQNQ